VIRDVQTTRVCLVRHGATDWNEDGRVQGRADVPLNARGVAEAQALRERLRTVTFDAAYTSTLRRARETAEIILIGSGVVPVGVAALAELSYGAWQGTTREEWRERDPEFAARWEQAPWTVAFSDGESLEQLHRRAVPIWDDIVQAHHGETVLVSAHGHLNRVLLLHLLDLPRERFWSIVQPNGSWVLVECDGRRVQVSSPQ
jgi:broad specificity phosphatase PhoE